MTAPPVPDVDDLVAVHDLLPYRPRRSGVDVEGGRRPAQHPILYRLRENGVDAAEVLLHLRHLAGDPGQELQVGLVRISAGLLTDPDEVVDLRVCRWPYRSMRPIRCSSLFALNGIS
jgi:hypothetical protein